MKEFLDYDDYYGVTEWFIDNGDGSFSIEYEQDVSKFLDCMKTLRNDENYSKQGIKEEWWHYSSIPATVIMELRKKGLSIFDKNCTKDIIKEINTNYPYLKATTKRHS